MTRVHRTCLTLSLAGAMLAATLLPAEAVLTRAGCHRNYNRCTGNCDRVYHGSSATSIANCIERCGGQYSSCLEATSPATQAQ